MLSNYQVADALSLLSKLMDIHGENSFKAKSYAAAAFQIEKLPLQLSELDTSKIASLKGIGDSTSKKVIELLQTGELKALTDLIKKTPPGVIEMLSIKGIGPKKISTIWKEMEIETIGELLYACEENRLLRYKGFGEKTQNSVKENIQFFLQHKDIYLFADIEAYATTIDAQLKQLFPNSNWSLTGEFRRHMEIIHQLEWVTTASLQQLAVFFNERGFETLENDSKVLTVKSKENIKLKFYAADERNFGTILFETTATADFLKQWGELKEASGEDLLFEQKGIAVIPAFLRDEYNTEPVTDLIDTSTIKALIHSHSNWSDGSNTVEEMANECIKRDWQYMVISDHSKSAGYANGLSVERIEAQHRYIDELNDKLKPFRIFKSIEADILGDGSLDYEDEILSTFDLVIASVHSNLKMTEEKAMMRLLRAIENPYTTILGHMTGRLLLSRNGYPVDHQKIIDACVANSVVIELNAHPRRLDIDWRWIEYAVSKGALISINPDAHELGGFNDVHYGVLAAQKGRLSNKQNLSSFTLQEFEEYIMNVRREKGI
jgi:DNA polymerase (family X)